MNRNVDFLKVTGTADVAQGASPSCAVRDCGRRKTHLSGVTGLKIFSTAGHAARLTTSQTFFFISLPATPPAGPPFTVKADFTEIYPSSDLNLERENG